MSSDASYRSVIIDGMSSHAHRSVINTYSTNEVTSPEKQQKRYPSFVIYPLSICLIELCCKDMYYILWNECWFWSYKRFLCQIKMEIWIFIFQSNWPRMESPGSDSLKVFVHLKIHALTFCESIHKCIHIMWKARII